MSGIKKWSGRFTAALAGQQVGLLVLSQGTSNFDGRSETEEGIDRKLALHYYGRQLIVRELAGVLTPDAKIMFILNGMEGSPSHINWDDLDLKSTYSMRSAAKQSATMLDIIIQHYAVTQKEEGTAKRHYAHVFPGGVLTGLTREWPWWAKAGVKVVAPFIATKPEECAKVLLAGLENAVVIAEEHGQFWSNIDHNGRMIEDKQMWVKSQRELLAEHTWRTIDTALNQ
jgi:hypothetical protein